MYSGSVIWVSWFLGNLIFEIIFSRIKAEFPAKSYLEENIMKIDLLEVTPGGIVRIFWFYGLAWLEAGVKLLVVTLIFALIVSVLGISIDAVKSVVPFLQMIGFIYLVVGHLWYFAKRLYAHFYPHEAARKKLSDCSFREIYTMLH